MLMSPFHILTTGARSPVPALQQLLVYYGFPIAWRGLWNAQAVAAEIARYAVWVVGDTYGDPAHEEIASTRAIVTAVRAAGTRVYGYVPVGQNTSGLTQAQMCERVDQWVALGVDGIFLDEFGFDYANTRARQAAIADYVHAKGLPYCANAWTAEDVMCDSATELPWPADDWRHINFASGNPGNAPLVRAPGDAYMFENFGFDHNGPTNIWDTQERAALTTTLAKAKGMQVWALAVLPETTPGTLNASKLGNLATLPNVGAYVAANAYLYDIEVVGLGGFSFGSNGTPIATPLPAMAATAQPATAPAAHDYTAGTAVRQFGPVGLTVTNKGSTRKVVVTGAEPPLLKGQFPPS